MPAKKKAASAKRLRRRCPACLKTKFRAVTETIGGIQFGLLICDNESCQHVLGAGPISTPY